MNEFRLSLIIAGVIFVLAVLIYNAWQIFKLRRKLPRPLSTADELNNSHYPLDDDPPFIDPSIFTTPPKTSISSPSGRQEPTFSHQKEAKFSAEIEQPPSLNINNETENLTQSALAQTKNKLLTNTNFIDERIDCIVNLNLSAPIVAERIMPMMQRFRRAGNKTVLMEGQPLASEEWESVQAGNRYQALKISVQLASRLGPLNEIEFSDFVAGVTRLADAIDADPSFPEMTKIVGMARELDAFAAQCDMQLSVNIISQHAPWSAQYIQRLAVNDGLLLSRDGVRFVKLDDQQNPIFSMLFSNTNFLRDDLTAKASQIITLQLEVPLVNKQLSPFHLMCDYGRALAKKMNAHLVDTQGKPLTEAAIASIEKQLAMIYNQLNQAQLPAGSAIAKRLFSN